MTEQPQVALVEDDPKKPYKAAVATVLTFVATVVTYWIADVDPFTGKEFAEAALAGGVAAGLIGGGTFVTSNPKRVRRSP